MDLGLKGLRAVVTGGTKGIGRRAADIFAEEGASVAICARNADEVKAAVNDLKAKGVNAFGVAIDVADKAALQKFYLRQRGGAQRRRHPRRQCLRARSARQARGLAEGVRRRHDAHCLCRRRRAALFSKSPIIPQSSLSRQSPGARLISRGPLTAP